MQGAVESLDESKRVNNGAIDVHAEMQMRLSGRARISTQTDDVAGVYGLSELHMTLAQVKIERINTATVVHDNRGAFEEEIIGEHYSAIACGCHRCSDGCR